MDFLSKFSIISQIPVSNRSSIDIPAGTGVVGFRAKKTTRKKVVKKAN